MNAVQIRVITNGYILSWMNGAEFSEYAFTDRGEMLNFTSATLDTAPEEGES